jgi:CheY-like chemotaxis protein
MDLQMPEMDGLLATRSIRRMEAGSGHTLILALTADVLPGTREACAKCGMDGYLTKPVRLADLAAEYRVARERVRGISVAV